jgi:iron complex outermembrane receptor protein
MLYRKILLAAASSVALVAGGQAVAQEAQPQAANPSGQAAESSGLDDIIVTAQKREQSLQDVPISITAFNAEAIASLGAQNVGDLDTFTPGLSVNDTSVTQPSYTIRGVSTDDFGIGTDPAVGIFIDGVYSARSGAALIFFNDIERSAATPPPARSRSSPKSRSTSLRRRRRCALAITASTASMRWSMCRSPTRSSCA